MTELTVPARTEEHCRDDQSWTEFVRQYHGCPRSFGELSDFELANAVFLVGRESLSLIKYQTAAKERIRWLSIELAKRMASFQFRVEPWFRSCFTPSVCEDKVERTDRFIEEALELAQAGGYSRERAHALVDYVFNRPAGQPVQEVGGVMVTLAAYCIAHGHDMHDAGDVELARISQPDVMEKIRAKQAAKPTGSALPVG